MEPSLMETIWLLEQRSQEQTLGCLEALRQLSPALRMKQFFSFRFTYVENIFANFQLLQFALKIKVLQKYVKKKGRASLSPTPKVGLNHWLACSLS